MTAQSSEARLVDRVRAGDAQALGELFTRYGQQVHDVAARLTRSVHDADDITQTVFMGLPEALDGYKATGTLGAWIRRVATRTALLHLRQRRRQVKWEREASRETPREYRPRAEGTEARLTLEDALNSMPEELRTVFVLREVEGHSHNGIADLLGITPGASAVRLHRARRFLRDRLKGKI